MKTVWAITIPWLFSMSLISYGTWSAFGNKYVPLAVGCCLALYSLTRGIAVALFEIQFELEIANKKRSLI